MIPSPGPARADRPRFAISSSSRPLLDKANRVAREFAGRCAVDGVVGIALLGAVARGYFDKDADIDIAVFRRRGAPVPEPEKFSLVEDIQVHCWSSVYEDEQAGHWDMAKRWTFSCAVVFYDPQGGVARLLEEKVPLGASERRDLLMSGLVLSEWYVNRLTRLWVERGNVTSAHHMVGRGLDYLFDALFALNNELVPDAKWRYYCLERLASLPRGLREGVRDTLLVRSLDPAELERRRATFMVLWEELRPQVEKAVGMAFDEMVRVV